MRIFSGSVPVAAGAVAVVDDGLEELPVFSLTQLETTKGKLAPNKPNNISRRFKGIRHLVTITKKNSRVATNPGQLGFLYPTDHCVDRYGDQPHDGNADENDIAAEKFTGIKYHPTDTRSSGDHFGRH